MMEEKRSFSCIEGLRVLLNFWVVAYHSLNLLRHVSDSPDVEKAVFLEYFNAPSLVVLGGLGIQVDIFFMISAFLLCMQLFQADYGADEWGAKSLLRSIPILIIAFLKRHLRLLPGVIVAVVFSWIVDDECFRIHSLSHVLMQMSLLRWVRPVPIALMVTWSNVVEVVGAVAVTAVVMSFGSFLNKPLGWLLSFMLLLLSVVPIIVSMHQHPEATVMVMDTAADRHLLPWMRQAKVDWIETLFPRMTTIRVNENPEALINFFQLFYLPWWCRLSPFFVGLPLAVAVWNTTRHYKSNEALSMIAYTKHSLLMLLSMLSIGQMILFAVSKAKKVATEGLSDPRIEKSVDLSHVFHPLSVWLNIVLRPVYAFGFAYLIYRCLLPTGHPLRLNFIDKILSGHIFQYLGKYTYLVYLIHFRVLISVMFGWITPSELDAVLGPHRGVIHALVYAAITYAASLSISIILYHTLEAPMQAMSSRCLKVLSEKMRGAARANPISTKNKSN